MYTDNEENWNHDHWVFPVDARQFHKATGMKTGFTTWMKHNIRLHRMQGGTDYFYKSEWCYTAHCLRNDFDLQYWSAKKIADKMTPEKKAIALDYLANILKTAAERRWHIYT
jgi:phage anti-repressor protein